MKSELHSVNMSLKQPGEARNGGAKRNGKSVACGTAAAPQLCIWLSHGVSQHFLYQVSSIHPQCETPIDERDELPAVSQATYTRYADKVTNKMSNSPAQKRARHHKRHQVSLPDASPPPSSPTRSGSPIIICFHSKGLLTAENDVPLWMGEEVTSRRTSLT